MAIIIKNEEARIAAEALNEKATDLRNRYEQHLAAYQSTGHEANREAAQMLSDKYQEASGAARAIRQALKRMGE